MADKFKSWALPVAAAVLAVGFDVASISKRLADRNRATPDQSQAVEQGTAAGGPVEVRSSGPGGSRCSAPGPTRSSPS